MKYLIIGFNKIKHNTYSDELKEQVVHECQQIGNVSMVARRHGISKPTVYLWVRKYKEKYIKNPNGRPIPGYSYHLSGHKVSDEQIKEYLMELVAGDGFPYGYRKLTECIREEYFINSNKKKVHRLCKELDILRPQRKLKKHHIKKLAKSTKVTNSNQIWEMEIKYGYIKGTDQFFFQLSLIDVFDRNIIEYHLGLSYKTSNAARVLITALTHKQLTKGMENLPTIRTDNGPQFISNLLGDTFKSLGLKHQRISVKTPNMNAHINPFMKYLEEIVTTETSL